MDEGRMKGSKGGRGGWRKDGGRRKERKDGRKEGKKEAGEDMKGGRNK